jgi:DNA-directed RNA polymerase subunit RPC12/RpoP
MEGDEAAAAAAAARIRVVRCPRCDKFLPELPAYSVYVCGGCGATLQGTRHGGCLLHSVFRGLCLFTGQRRQENAGFSGLFCSLFARRLRS